MAKFIIRIDLDGISLEEQKKFENNLMKFGIHTVIYDEKDKNEYLLPIYQYYYEGEYYNLQTIFDLVVELAKDSTRKFEITVHEVNRSMWIGLKKLNG